MPCPGGGTGTGTSAPQEPAGAGDAVRAGQSGDGARKSQTGIQTFSRYWARGINLPEASLPALAIAALFHDAAWRSDAPAEHPRAGADLFAARLPGLARKYSPALEIMAQHHELFHGQGYPKGKAGAAIHPLARLFQFLDGWLAASLPARPGDGSRGHDLSPGQAGPLPPHQALSRMVTRSLKEGCWDSGVVRKFLERFSFYPVGTPLALGWIKERKSLGPLIEALDREEDGRVRKAVGATLNRITGYRFEADPAVWRNWWLGQTRIQTQAP